MAVNSESPRLYFLTQKFKFRVLRPVRVKHAGRAGKSKRDRSSYSVTPGPGSAARVTANGVSHGQLASLGTTVTPVRA